MILIIIINASISKAMRLSRRNKPSKKFKNNYSNALKYCQTCWVFEAFDQQKLSRACIYISQPRAKKSKSKITGLIEEGFTKIQATAALSVTTKLTKINRYSHVFC